MQSSRRRSPDLKHVKVKFNELNKSLLNLKKQAEQETQLFCRGCKMGLINDQESHWALQAATKQLLYTPHDLESQLSFENVAIEVVSSLGGNVILDAKQKTYRPTKQCF